ncbi:MAG TPA: hypothetical protein VFY39_08690 [Gammaproteobacteria bacterium]|nr:hypothetical protein [Gammaproteobacteria bacterium]
MKPLLVLVLAAASLSALIRPHAAGAQERDLQKRLAGAKRIDCRFTALATGTWEGGSAHAAIKPVEIEAVFFDIDVDGGTAEAKSDFGNKFIVVRYSHGYLHFMQLSEAGPLRVTTVIAEETPKGRFKAVQSRHEYSAVALPGYTSRPEMYVGDCAVESTTSVPPSR